MYKTALFPLYIKGIISEGGLTVGQLAERADLSPGTIRSWINAGCVPDTYSVLKLSQCLDRKYRPDLLESALRWRYLRGKTYLTGEFSLKDALEEMIHDTSGKSSSLSSDQLAEVIEFWQAAKEHVPSKSQLIIPPQPSLILIDNWPSAIKEIARNNKILYTLDWKQFEDLIGYLLKQFGWSITHMGYTKDGGIDIIAIMKVLPDITIRMMVQCKKFALGKKVGVDIVKQIWADKWEKGFNEAMVATTSSFTKGATQKAEVWNIVLKDHNAITDWCKQYGKILEF